MQNRKLRTWLGERDYARFEDDWREQLELREFLQDKPKRILEYERRFKCATLTYSKADSFSRRGNDKAAKDLFHDASIEFERLAEYLSEILWADPNLRYWFDRDFDRITDAPFDSPEPFPRVITSRSLENCGGGHLTGVKTKRQTKIDAVERALADMKQNDGEEASKIAERMSTMRKLKNLTSD